MTTTAALMNELFPDGLEPILYEESPSWGMVKKWKKFGGKGKHMAWEFAPSGGASSVFANAQANKSAGSYERPFITRVKEYALASMDGEAQEASEGDEVAVAEVFETAMNGALYNLNRSVSFNAFRNGGGARGQLAAATSGVGTTTITLTSTSSMQGFEKNMWVNASATDGTSGTVLAGKAQITGVNRTARTLTTTAAWNTLIPGITDSYYLFRDGDFGNVIKGFQAWIPDSAPTAGDSFFGIDRSDDPDRLAGIRYAPGSGTTEEILVAASALAFDFGAKPDLVIMHPLDHANLVNSMSTKNKIEVNAVDKPTIGYKGVELMGATGAMAVLSDPMCQRYKAWMLTQDTWEDWCLGDIPRVLDRDGNKVMREPNADADELRVGGYLQRVCKNPGKNVNITLPTAT